MHFQSPAIRSQLNSSLPTKGEEAIHFGAPIQKQPQGLPIGRVNGGLNPAHFFRTFCPKYEPQLYMTQQVIYRTIN